MTNNFPKAGQIKSIYVVNDKQVVFKITCYSSTYSEHFRVYKLKCLQMECFVFLPNLVIPFPVHIHVTSSFPHQSVILPYDVTAY